MADAAKVAAPAEAPVRTPRREGDFVNSLMRDDPWIKLEKLGELD
jgi:hypothetical protein